MKKCVIYARVSSREQERDGYSIPAQLKLLNDYAVKNGLLIEKEFTDNETAKKEGRTNFEAMLNFLRRNKDVTIILVEKTDRLYRNFRDYVTLDEFRGLEIHLVKEGGVLSENSRSHEKFIHGIKVLMAKNYIDNLSEEVKKGHKQKAEQGEYPFKPPYGYYRENPKTIKINTVEAPFVLRAYSLYSKGDISLKSLSEKLYDEGLFYKRNNPKIYTSQLEKILKNPFYLGNFMFNGVLYSGNHEPLISMDIYEKVQNAFKKDSKPTQSTKHSFMFTGMLKCPVCGSAIVGEIKKGKYIYYHCTNRKTGTCTNTKHVREEVIERQLREAIKAVSITKEHKEAIVTALKESHVDERKFHEEQIQKLQRESALLRNRINKLYTDKLDGIITEEFWQIKNNEWVREHSRIGEDIERHIRANKSYMEEGLKWLELTENLYPLYLRQENTEKAKMLKIVCSNFFLEGENVRYDYKKPFDILAKGLAHTLILGRKDSSLRMPGPKPGALPLGYAPLKDVNFILYAEFPLSRNR